jgi:predicted lipoprotein with Yx(FWY)xxD motif
MTTRKPFTLLGAAAVPLVALGVAACGGGGGATAAQAPPKAAAPHSTIAARHAVTKVRVASNSKLGKILVDSRGRTLYLFSKDTRTKSACSGACATPWPPLRANGKLSAGSGVTASKLGTIKRSDGKPQVTYNGHPLYGFVMDKKAGDTKGEGLTAFGGHWFAISPAGKQVSPKKSGGGSASRPAAPKPAPAPAAPKPAPAPVAPKPAPAPAAPKPPSNPIPQNGGGDGDSDNSGGPSDGDGNV